MAPGESTGFRALYRTPSEACLEASNLSEDDPLLFTDSSIWTMIHGILLSGAALMALAAAIPRAQSSRRSSRVA
jgi:hypothetical protein